MCDQNQFSSNPASWNKSLTKINRIAHDVGLQLLRI